MQLSFPFNNNKKKTIQTSVSLVGFFFFFGTLVLKKKKNSKQADQNLQKKKWDRALRFHEFILKAKRRKWPFVKLVGLHSKCAVRGINFKKVFIFHFFFLNIEDYRYFVVLLVYKRWFDSWELINYTHLNLVKICFFKESAPVEKSTKQKKKEERRNKVIEQQKRQEDENKDDEVGHVNQSKKSKKQKRSKDSGMERSEEKPKKEKKRAKRKSEHKNNRRGGGGGGRTYPAEMDKEEKECWGKESRKAKMRNKNDSWGDRHQDKAQQLKVMNVYDRDQHDTKAWTFFTVTMLSETLRLLRPVISGYYTQSVNSFVGDTFNQEGHNDYKCLFYIGLHTL
ncbi:hypothetical protein RFI_15624 [Reticulomyxa filosa]|uniref:Uncharacterized protein n=1 Tax=Reticulomyxa filosa TaxID=46433 RepID=X6N5M2_RETFI|nr:hypothetical protein RFI_15624 [Reticulomyxa filosa]|eukprot:ETO21580.1 hypothetical protein RFI_15624 [Reticulomyxa filosa]